MMDDLQKAYTAYQQALYHLPNPKVISLLQHNRDCHHHHHRRHMRYEVVLLADHGLCFASRTPICGTALESCTIATGRSTMPRRPSPRCLSWTPRDRKSVV